MKLLTILGTTLTVVLAQDVMGIMLLSTLEFVPNRKFLRLEGNKILADAKKSSAFDFTDKNAVKITEEEKYLSLNSEGRLIVADTPHPEFNLTSNPRSYLLRTLTYNGNKVFQLCDDGSVSFHSGCEGARQATISFKDVPLPAA